MEGRLLVRPPWQLMELGLVPPEELWWVRSALYGQRNAPNRWRQTIYRWLTEVEKITPCVYDDCLFFDRHPRLGVLFVVVLYVDDILCFGPGSVVDQFFARLQARFKSTAAAQVKVFIGL